MLFGRVRQLDPDRGVERLLPGPHEPFQSGTFWRFYGTAILRFAGGRAKRRRWGDGRPASVEVLNGV